MAFGLSTNVGIDLGTTNIIIYISGKGIVLKEPAMVAYDRNEDEIEAFGEEARQMVERTPGNITALYPLNRGVVSNYTVTEKMLKYFLWKAIGKKKLRKPQVYISVPTQATEVERRAIMDAAEAAGASRTIPVDAALMAALGAGIDIGREQGNMVVDVGGGVTEIAVIASGGVVLGKTLPIAGNDFDEAIIEFIRKKHRLMIGRETAESLKRRIGTCQNQLKVVSLDIKGRDLTTGLSEIITVSSAEIKEALESNIGQIVEAIRYILEITPPELKKSLTEQGIMLAGAGALLNGLETRLEKEFDITVMTAENPIFCTAIGAGRYPEFLKKRKSDK